MENYLLKYTAFTTNNKWIVPQLEIHLYLFIVQTFIKMTCVDGLQMLYKYICIKKNLKMIQETKEISITSDLKLPEVLDFIVKDLSNLNDHLLNIFIGIIPKSGKHVFMHKIACDSWNLLWMVCHFKKSIVRKNRKADLNNLYQSLQFSPDVWTLITKWEFTLPQVTGHFSESKTSISNIYLKVIVLHVQPLQLLLLVHI